MISWIRLWILWNRFFSVINCDTFYSQSKSIFVITFFFISSIFCIYNGRWSFLKFFKSWGRFIKLICAFMNSYPFSSWDNKNHNIIKLFSNLSNSTKHENCSCHCMSDHYMSFSLLWPIFPLLSWGFLYFCPTQGLEIKKPHIIKYLIWISATENIKFIFNNTWT